MYRMFTFFLFMISIQIFITMEIIGNEYIIGSTLDLPDFDLNDDIFSPPTLRSAIQNINKHGIPAIINCANIEYQVIKLQRDLPAINVPVIFKGKGIVLEPLEGSKVSGGLAFQGDGSQLYDVKFRNFDRFGLFWKVNDGVISNIVSCFNNGPGILLNYANRNTIGKEEPGYYSLLLYGNKGDGGSGLQALYSNHNIIQYCWAGMDNLQNPVPNERYGINIIDGQHNIIRYSTVNSNEYGGIGIRNKEASQTNTLIEKNHIGTDPFGATAFPGHAIYGGIVFDLSSGDTIRNNVISGNTGSGILIQRSNNIVIENNKIGTNKQGTETISNSFGIVISGFNHKIINNLVSGNKYNGISLNGYDIVLQSNIIGLDNKQEKALPNGSIGIEISNTADSSKFLIIGDTVGNNGNIISGNKYHGINILGASTKNVIISKNYIGSNNDTSKIFPNDGSGVFITHSLKNIYIKDNIISANNEHGVRIERNVVYFLDTNKPNLYQKPSQIYVQNNCIGCVGQNNKVGKHGGSGISVLNAFDIFIDNNIIIGTTDHGIDIANDSTRFITIRKNKIGPESYVDTVKFIGKNGININGAKDVSIGSPTNAQDSNIIMHSNGYGLMVKNSALRVYYYINKMYDNKNGGIALDSLKEYFDSGNYNDKMDADTGSNNLQNTFYMSVADAKNETVSLNGLLNGEPNKSYRIDVYLAKKLDDSTQHRTQGSIHIGNFKIYTSEKGIAEIDTSWSDNIIGVNSSEFSRATLTVSGIYGTSPFSIIYYPNLYVDIDVKIDTLGSYYDKNGNTRILAIITNLGNYDATTVSIRDTIPNFNVLEYSISNGVINKFDSTIIATIPKLGPGDTVTYECFGFYTNNGHYLRSIKAIPLQNDININNNVDTILFKINSINQLAPIPRYPPKNQRNIDNPLRIIWFKQKNAIRYHLQVSKVPFTNKTDIKGDFYQNISYIVNDSNLTDTTYTIKVLEGNQTYYWRVAGIYDDNTKYWSDELTFSTVPITDVELINSSSSNISIFPNPASDYLEISLLSLIQKEEFNINNTIYSNFDLKIYNHLGQCLIVHQKFQSIQRIDISALPPGIYFVRLGKWTERFIKL